MDPLSALISPPALPPKLIAGQLRSSITTNTRNLLEEYSRKYQAFWSDPIAVCKELGVDAASIILYSSKTATFLTSLIVEASIRSGQTEDQAVALAATLVPGIKEGWTLTPNPDGTVVPTQKAP